MKSMLLEEEIHEDNVSGGVTTLPREEYVVNPLATIGLEMELFVRNDELEPAGEAAKSLADQTRRCLDDEYCVGSELPIDMLEVRTRPHATLENLLMDLFSTLSVFTEEAEDEGLLILPVSVDPTAQLVTVDWSDKRVADFVLSKFGRGVALLSNVAALQVNIEVGDGNAALFIHAALRRIVPHLVALTANSPFYRGQPSGLLAMRPILKALLADGGLVAEDIREVEWHEYFEKRSRMCAIGSAMPNPWFNHMPLRLRPDRNMCIEVACLEVVPDVRMVVALSDFLRRLVTRIALAYKHQEPIPDDVFGPFQQLGLRKCMQEAVLKGRRGTFLNANLQPIPAWKAIEKLIQYAGEAEGDPAHAWSNSELILQEALDHGSPAERLMSRFNELHHCPVTGYGCPDCIRAVKAVLEETAWQFHAQFKS